MAPTWYGCMLLQSLQALEALKLSMAPLAATSSVSLSMFQGIWSVVCGAVTLPSTLSGGKVGTQGSRLPGAEVHVWVASLFPRLHASKAEAPALRPEVWWEKPEASPSWIDTGWWGRERPP